MALVLETVFVEIDDTNTIVGIHSDTIDSKDLPAGYSIVAKTIEDPQGLLGLPDSQIDTAPGSRTVIAVPTTKEGQRAELKNLSDELDLMVRLGESTTTVQADFDAKKTIYNALP